MPCKALLDKTHAHLRKKLKWNESDKNNDDNYLDIKPE